MFNRNHRSPQWNKPEKPSGSQSSKNFPLFNDDQWDVQANLCLISRNSEDQVYSGELDMEFQEFSIKDKAGRSRKRAQKRNGLPNNELQQKWQHLVLTVANRLPQGNAKLVLTRYAFHDNVPRKKKQFLNFLRSSCHLHDNDIGEGVWNTLEEELEKMKEEGIEVPAELFTSKKKTFYRRGRRVRDSSKQEPSTPTPAPETPPPSSPPFPHLTVKGPRSKRQPKAQKFEDIEEKLKEKEKDKKEELSGQFETPKREKPSYGQMSPFGDEAAKEAIETSFKWRRTIAEEIARNKGLCGYDHLRNTVINCYRSTVIDYTTSDERLNRLFKKKFELFGLTVENRMVVIQKAFV